MPRFDPNSYPDRLAFEAHARRIRGEEIDREFHAAAAWLQDLQHRVACRLGKFAADHSIHSHERLTH